MVVDINVNEKQKACSEGIHSYPQRVFATEWCTRTDTFIALPLGRCFETVLLYFVAKLFSHAALAVASAFVEPFPVQSVTWNVLNTTVFRITTGGQM